MRILKGLCAGAVLLMASGCGYWAPVMPPGGLFYSSIDAPLDHDAEKTPKSSKMGEAKSQSILCLFAFGDASSDAAARDGGLTKIEYMDYHYTNVFFFYQEFVIRAYGE